MESSNVNHDCQMLRKLDDDCMRKVFNFLHLRDLSNAAEVCKRFKSVAESAFESRYGKQTLDMLQLVEGDRNFHDQWFMVRWLTEKFLMYAEQLFRNFGRLVKGLRLTGTGEMGGMNENDLLLLIMTYCYNLKVVTLDDLGRSDDFSTELLQMFGGLEKLSVSTADVSDSFVACLSDCHNLTYLDMSYVPAKTWLSHKFPKLENLVISNNWELDYTEFESFLELHENLRKLTYNDTYVFSGFFATLLKAAKLETFLCNVAEIFDSDDDLEEVKENISQLSRLKSLKRLTFTCDASVLNELVKAFEKEDTPIEHISLVDSTIDRNVIVSLSELKWLKTLKLERCELTEETVIDMNNHLGQLQKVIIKDIEGICLNTKIQFAANVCVMKTSIRRRPDTEQDSSAILKTLNDDCLFEIFKMLALSELCTVADVCKRFRESAQKVFQLYHWKLETRELLATDVVGYVTTDMVMAEKMFRNFGFFIKELKVQGRFFGNSTDQENILFLATKYCISMAFDTLTLTDIKINVEMRWLVPLLDMFHILPKLELHWCELNKNFGRFLSICKITSIQLYSPYGSGDWMNHTFFYLQRMIMLDSRMPESAMHKFIELNGHLQSFIIHQSNLSSNIFKAVADHMPNLQEFTFMGRNPRDPKTRNNVLHLTRLKSLTKLSLNCSSFSVNNLVDELSRAATPISEFTISFGAIDMELLEKLFSFPLRRFQLSRVNMMNVSLIDVVKKLPELNELHIDIRGIVLSDVIKMLPFAEKLSKLFIGSVRSNVQIDVGNYKSILAIVKSRHKAMKLRIDISSQKRHVFVPKHLLEQNIYWLEINNQITENLHLVVSDSESAGEEDSDEDDGSEISVEDSDDNAGSEVSVEDSEDNDSSEVSVDDDFDMDIL